MSTDHYRKALDAATREYETVAAEHARLDARLAQLQETIATLSKLCGFVPTVPMGLTDACRMVLRNAAAPMSATEVRDRLGAAGINLGHHSNPLASIHTVLKRLEEAGEVSERDRRDGGSARSAYTFIGGRAVRRYGGEGLCPPKDRKR